MFFFYKLLLVSFFQLFALFLVLVYYFIGVFHVRLDLVDIQLNLGHQIDLYLFLFRIDYVVLVSQLLRFVFCLLSLLQNVLLLFLQSLNLLLLTFVFFLKGLADFSLAFNLISGLLELVLHSDDLHVQVLCAFGVVVGGVLDFEHVLLELLLPFSQLNIFRLNHLDFLHVLLQIAV